MKEGLYEDYEGKAVDFKDRTWDQEEISRFLNTVFVGTKQQLNYEEYSKINHKVSSEMFFSLM